MRSERAGSPTRSCSWGRVAPARPPWPGSSPRPSTAARHKRYGASRGGKSPVAARRLNGGAAPQVPDADAGRLRFTAKGLQSHRDRLGVAAADYGRLIGVTGQTIYKWEHGAARPRKQQLVALATLRGLGKKEARARLDQPGAKIPRKRKAKR